MNSDGHADDPTMRGPVTGTGTLREEFDFSTPEGEAAMRAALALVLEVREMDTSPLARKVRLYERTLGLAVIPVLVRQAFLSARRRSPVRRRGGR